MQQWIESRFTTFDGLSLFFRYRKPKGDSKNTLLFLHRGHEHSGRIVSLAEDLSHDNYWCFSFDLRGHGYSHGRRAWAPNFDTWVKDLNCFMGFIQQSFGVTTNNTVLVSNSVGSVMAVSWILKYGPKLKGCILGAPAFSIKLYVPLALPSLRMLSKFTNDKFVTSYVRSNLLTRDPAQAKAYDEDSLITKKIGVNVLVTLFDDYKRLSRRLKDFETPVLMFSAEKDYIVNNKAHTFFYNNISSSEKKHITLDGFKHAIFHELEQEKIIQPSVNFIDELFSKEEKHLPAVITPARPHTVDEYKKLVNNTSKPKKLYYDIFRTLLSSIGRHSEGVSIGLKYGFDSGVSLDYIYKNTPTGSNWFGRLIDRVYLNSVGWRGIRIRKQNLKSTLIGITNLVNNTGKEPLILDIAAGAGRYLFECQKELDYSIQLHLNDLDEASIAHAKKNADSFESTKASFTNFDVFKGIAAQSFAKKPNIIIISGLFELYENNQSVQFVINNMYELLENDGYIIYTGQPWHPQIELIANLLNNRHGKPWQMRRRIQSEIDELINSAGFIKMNTEADDLGIFTVSCAQKITN